MKTVWKYQFEAFEAVKDFMIPMEATFLRCNSQKGLVTMWFLVQTTNILVKRRFFYTATGQSVHFGTIYCGSCTQGEFEWHVWEERIPS